MNKSEKCSLSQKNRIVINKDEKEKRIYSKELNDYLCDGWKLGVTEKHRLNNSRSNKGKPKKSSPVSEETRNKISQTLKSKYSSKEIQVWNKGLTKETDERVKNYCEKSKETKIDRYGTTCFNKGKHLTEEHKRKIGLSNSISLKGKHLPKDKLIIKTTKQYLTRKKNNTFNTSNQEKILYEDLLNNYSNCTILRNYKDWNRYPFYCDFYIVEKDLFIELNAHWTHGGRPYDPNDVQCQKQLEEWKEKAKNSKFYENAIQTWTIRDVEKQKIAKENNLNYRVIY